MCIHNLLFFYCFLLLQQSDISCSLAPPCLNHLIHPAFLMRAKVRNIALVSSLFNPRYFTLRFLHLSTFFLPLALFHLSLHTHTVLENFTLSGNPTPTARNGRWTRSVDRVYPTAEKEREGVCFDEE